MTLLVLPLNYYSKQGAMVLFYAPLYLRWFSPPHIIYTPVQRIVAYYERIHKSVAFIIV